MAFELQEAGPADLDDVVYVMSAAWASDELWKTAWRDATAEAEHSFMADALKSWFHSPGCHYYKIVDTSTGKMVAWTGLSFPFKLNAEQKALLEHMPPFPKGLNTELLLEYYGHAMGGAANNGFDGEKHFHRRGTMVHPDYQRQGLGCRMTSHCNSIADQAGEPTFVVAGRKSKPMFQKMGFEILANVDVDMEKFGGTKESGENWVLRRKPRPV